MEPVEHALLHLNQLIRQGQDICAALAATPRDGATEAAARVWQRDCAALVNELSGGSKAHWLSRAFSEAFLIQPSASAPGADADPGEILRRIIDVLGRGASALEQSSVTSPQSPVSPQAPVAGPRPHRFDFVHDTGLRPILEGALTDSQQALERGDFPQALLLSCSILDAILTDALESKGHDQSGEWTFALRIAAAEQAGLTRNSCARLPAVARQYRDLTDEAGEVRADAQISPRDARVAAQVLKIVMNDLDPGR